MRIQLIYLFILLQTFSAQALNRIDFSSPEASFKTFYSAMSDYSEGIKTGNQNLKLRLSDALEVLEPVTEGKSPYSTSHLEDKAILLKEIIDRVSSPSEPLFDGSRLQNTNIFFIQKNNWFYISNYSLERAEKDYKTLSELPYQKGILYPGASHKETWLEVTFPKGSVIKYFGVTQIQWILMLSSILAAIFLYYFSAWILGLLERLIFSKKEFSFKLANALTQPIAIFIAAFFLKAAGLQMVLNGNVKFIWFSSTKVLLSVGFFWMLYCLIEPLEAALKKITARTESELDDNLVPLLSKTGKILIVLLGSLNIIQGLGINVFSLLAGLGVGGLAIALAAKDTAANFFGSLMILFDQPFKIGDWIKIGDLEGTVEEIGFRSTRVRTFYDSQIVIPNSKVANEDIDNLGRRKYRRTVETLGVTYSTTEEQLQSFISGLKEIIQNHPLTRKDKHYVSFKKFGDSSLEILLYFFLNVSDYKDELVAKEEILFKIKKLAETLKIDFAFPSQSIYIESNNANA